MEDGDDARVAAAADVGDEGDHDRGVRAPARCRDLAARERFEGGSSDYYLVTRDKRGAVAFCEAAAFQEAQGLPVGATLRPRAGARLRQPQPVAPRYSTPAPII